MLVCLLSLTFCLTSSWFWSVFFSLSFLLLRFSLPFLYILPFFRTTCYIYSMLPFYYYFVVFVIVLLQIIFFFSLSILSILFYLFFLIIFDLYYLHFCIMFHFRAFGCIMSLASLYNILKAINGFWFYYNLMLSDNTVQYRHRLIV